jgi:lysophospholipase L1-like esterase
MGFDEYQTRWQASTRGPLLLGLCFRILVNACNHPLAGKTTRTLLVMLAALAVPYSSPRLAALRVVRAPWSPPDPPESRDAVEDVAPAPSTTVGEQSLPSSENTPTINNALSNSSRSPLPDIDPRVRETLREVPIEDGTGHALDAFFEHLARTDRKQAGAITRILHYGDSTIASDYVSGTVRRRMQARFGDAGHGFILMANPWEWYFHNDVFHASSGEWSASRLAGPWASDGMYGLGGVSFSSYGGGVAKFGTATRGDFGRRVSRFDVYYLEQPGGGEIEVGARGGTPLRISTRGDEKVSRVYRVHTADGEAQVTVRAAGGGPVRLFGVALERDQPGVVYDALGSHAAMAVFWQHQNRAHWKDQFALRDASLVILQYGTNESEGTLDGPEYEEALGALVEELKEVAGGASVLIAAPLDRAVNRGGRIVTRSIIVDLVAYQKRVASAHRVAFWNTFEAMGGEGSMAAWVRARPELGGPDLTHPTPMGAEVLGDMMSDALTRAYDAWRAR